MGSKLLERYSSAVNSGDLSVNPDTRWSDTDVLGAAGLAGRHDPLGVALIRLFADGKPDQALATLSEMAYGRSHYLKVRISKVQAEDLAMAVLGWHRFGTCQPCGGTGHQTITGTPVQGEECPRCRGTGKVPFETQFHHEVRELARWLSGEIDRSQVAAGRTAMTILAPNFDL